jgi:hypothetical protein
LVAGKPGLEFNNNEFYPFDFNGLANNYYTFSFVETRKSAKFENYLFGNQATGSNAGLHIGYQSSSTVRLAQFANDCDITIDAYSNPINRIWVFSYNVRGFEIWLNRHRMGQRPNTQGLSSCNNGNFGRGHTNVYYVGTCCGFAVHLGNRNESEIQSLFDYWNSEYLVY